MAEQQWFAVQTKVRQESLAEENLKRQHYTTYLPLIQVRKRRRDKWVEQIEPLFPGYVFLQLEVGETSVAPVRSTVGVLRLIEFGGKLASIPDNIIGFLKGNEETSGLHSTIEQPMQLGDIVEVLEGPFAGLKGIYQLQKSSQRVEVLMNILGSQQSITLGGDAIIRSK